MITKKRKEANAKVDAKKAYSLQEASALVKEINTTKFDSSVDIHIRLGVDPKKQIRQFVELFLFLMVRVKQKKC